jgi:hypothetical protein
MFEAVQRATFQGTMGWDGMGLDGMGHLLLFVKIISFHLFCPVFRFIRFFFPFVLSCRTIAVHIEDD